MKGKREFLIFVDFCILNNFFEFFVLLFGLFWNLLSSLEIQPTIS